MFNKCFLVPAILSVAGLLMGASSAFAQRGGGGHGGGGHGGGGHASGGHMSGGHTGGTHISGAHYGGHNYGGHGGGYYGGGFYGGGYYPGIFGGSYPWYDSYSYPRYSYYDAPAVQYYTPATEYYVRPAPAVADFANIRVIVPDPQARVWFDGNGTKQTGTDRLFNSPSLTIGSTYNYQIRVSWTQDGKEVSQERTVSVTPGQTTFVDFTR